MTGEVLAGNPKLAAEPETINTDSYGEGWLMRVRPTPGGPTTQLLSSTEYEKLQVEEGD